jgi:signal transduction histidine kinase
VFVSAFDKTRYENLLELRKILLWSILFSTLLSVFLSYLFSEKAIQPISRIIKSLKSITSLRMRNRLDEGNRKDEIDKLAITINEILDKLEISFRSQEEFVSNASHELRTPLTVMIIEIDYLLSHKRCQEEYVSHLKGLVSDLMSLNSLLNSLLELAQVNTDNYIQFSEIRIDETVYDAIHQVKSKYPDRKIIPKIQYPENENELLVSGNDGLLQILFKNLIENSCKFSNDDVIVEFVIMDKALKIIIMDHGVGIPGNELDSIYLPFKRASNVKFKSGFGIGLSLVKKIVELHGIELEVNSTENEGTSFNLMFQKANQG